MLKVTPVVECVGKILHDIPSHEGDWQEQGVESVEEASVTWEHTTRVLYNNHSQIAGYRYLDTSTTLQEAF